MRESLRNWLPLAGTIFMRLALAVFFLSATSVALNAQSSLSSGLLSVDDIPQVSFPRIDADAENRAFTTQENAPPRFAIPFTNSSYNAMKDGVWEQNDMGWSIWRLRLRAPGAMHINLGFSKYIMPAGGSLHLIGTEGSTVVFTEADNKPHHELWTPIIHGSALKLEVNLPPGTIMTELDLILTSVYSGFRSFLPSTIEKSGACNIDVACSEGDEWKDEISSVGVFGQGGSFFCTGTLINNAMNDRTPYFLTARHCGISDSSEARSVVVYWNFEKSSCGGSRDGRLNQFQSGASIVASSSATDFTLLLLDKRPDDDWNVHYSGWDRSGSPLTRAVTIHHPSGDEKSISIETNAPLFVSHIFSFFQEDSGLSIFIAGWDKGATEFGSSGAALFDSNRRIVGQLVGGASSCGNKLPDWFGSLVGSWTGEGTPSTRLGDWLDPSGSDVLTVDTLGPPKPAPSPTPNTPVIPTIPIEECFSGSNTVEVYGVGLVYMSDLQLGDRVRTCTGGFSPVYSFFHKQADRMNKYIRITSDSGDQRLEISANHMMFANGRIVRAAHIQEGDEVPGKVLTIEREVYRQGLYAPVTQAGNLVVSGVCVSSYVALWSYDASWLQNWSEHSTMAVFRALCRDKCSWETYDAETGFGMQYLNVINLVAWIQATGGMVAALGATFAAAPFLVCFRTIEIAVAQGPWYTMGTICAACLLFRVLRCNSTGRGNRTPRVYKRRID